MNIQNNKIQLKNDSNILTVNNYGSLEKISISRIARRLNISKYKVNRILKRALKDGMIEIKIIKPKDFDVKCE